MHFILKEDYVDEVQDVQAPTREAALEFVLDQLGYELQLVVD